MRGSASTCFLPGQNLNIRPEWYRAARPWYERAHIHSPGRVHMSVFDFSKMAPGLGGGGLGISVDTDCSDLLIAAGGGKSDLAPSAQHLLHLFSQCVDYDCNDLDISVMRRIRYTHAGFGSNVTFNTALLAGLNALFGSPFSIAEIWTMLTANYVENANDDTHIYRGLDTGVGEACVLHGGLVWVDEGVAAGDGRFLGSIPTPGLWVVTAVGKQEHLAGEALRALGAAASCGLGGQSEADIVAGLCQDYQDEYGAALHRFLRTRMRPAFLRNDLGDLLANAWELNAIGNMKVLEGIYQPGILRHLTATMKRAGALFAGMSSAGPGFFAFAESEMKAYELCAILESDFSNEFTDFVIGHAGTKLRVAMEAPITDCASHGSEAAAA